MVVIIPKKRQCKKCFSVGYISLLLGAALLLCYLTGVRMTAWNDFIGQGAQGLEGGKASLFPRSLSPLYDYQKTLWGGGGVGGGAKEAVGSEVEGDGAGAGVVPGAKVKRGAMVDGGSDHADVVNAKGNFDINDLSGNQNFLVYDIKFYVYELFFSLLQPTIVISSSFLAWWWKKLIFVNFQFLFFSCRP